MSSIDVRTEKANAVFRYWSIQRITILFRFIEICVFLVVISTFSVQLPFSVRISADHFRGISFAGFSPKFVFVIGNMIILILLFKSRAAENGDPYGKIDVYDEYVKRCATRDIVAIQKRRIRRSQSEKVMRVECNDSQRRRKLARSVTERKLLKNVDCCGGEKPSPEICRSESEKVEKKMLKNVDCCGGEPAAAESCGVDGLSSEAFRRTVEAFIARQQRSLRDEELAPVPYVGA